jgi:tubulin--tyrosine ligase
LLITCFKGIYKAYWFPEGYIRTSSTPFSLRKTANLFVHLTNDAIQKNSTEYGKYEKGNKVSYQEMNEYLLKLGYLDNFFSGKILANMKNQALKAVKSTYFYLDKQRK